MGRIIPYIMENESHVPNHQPVYISLTIINHYYPPLSTIIHY